MRLGVCTTDFDRAPAEAIFQKAASFGFDCVQLALDSISECGFEATGECEIPVSVPESSLAAIRAASEKYHLPIAVMNGTFNMAHPDPQVLRDSLHRFPGFLDMAMALQCPMVSLCSGTRNAAHLWRPHPDNTTPEAYQTMLAAMKEVTREAEKRNIVLAIETEASNVISTPEIAYRTLQDVGSPNLNIILDCANLFLPGQAYRLNARASLDKAFYWFGSQIALAHGKDIHPGSGISFCATGHGMVDFPHALHLLRTYGFTGDMMIHGVYEDALFPAAQRYMRDLIRKVF